MGILEVERAGQMIFVMFSNLEFGIFLVKVYKAFTGDAFDVVVAIL
jgi:hypothetical protein